MILVYYYYYLLLLERCIMSRLVQIAKIREDVDYYISSCRESDFEENEELYDDLDLEAASAALGSRLAAMNHDNDDHSSDVSSEAPSLQNSAGSVSPSPSLAHSRVPLTTALVVVVLLLLLHYCYYYDNDNYSCDVSCKQL